MVFVELVHFSTFRLQFIALITADSAFHSLGSGEEYKPTLEGLNVVPLLDR